MKIFRLAIKHSQETPSNLILNLEGVDAQVILKLDGGGKAEEESNENDGNFTIDLTSCQETYLRGSQLSRTSDVSAEKTISNLLSAIDVQESGGFIPPEVEAELEEADIIQSSQCEDEPVESIIPGLYSSPEKPKEASSSSWDDVCYVPETQNSQFGPARGASDAEIISSDEEQVANAEEGGAGNSSVNPEPEGDGSDAPAEREENPGLRQTQAARPSIELSSDESESQMEPVGSRYGSKKFKKKVVVIMSSDDEDEDDVVVQNDPPVVGTIEKSPEENITPRENDGYESDVVIETQPSTYRKITESPNDVNENIQNVTSVPETEEPDPVNKNTEKTVAERTTSDAPIEETDKDKEIVDAPTKEERITRKKLYSSQEKDAKRLTIGKIVDSQEMDRYSIGNSKSPSSRKRVRIPQKLRLSPVAPRETGRKGSSKNPKCEAVVSSTEDEILAAGTPNTDLPPQPSTEIPETGDSLTKEPEVDPQAKVDEVPETVEQGANTLVAEAVEVTEPIPELEVEPPREKVAEDLGEERKDSALPHDEDNGKDEFEYSLPGTSKSTRAEFANSDAAIADAETVEAQLRTTEIENVRSSRRNSRQEFLKKSEVLDVGPVVEYQEAIEGLSADLGLGNVKLVSPFKSPESKENQPARKRKSSDRNLFLSPKKQKALANLENEDLGAKDQSVEKVAEGPVTRKSRKREAIQEVPKKATARGTRQSTRSSKRISTVPSTPSVDEEAPIRKAKDTEVKAPTVVYVPETATEDSSSLKDTPKRATVGTSVEETPTETPVIAPKRATVETHVQGTSKVSMAARKSGRVSKKPTRYKDGAQLSLDDPYNKETVGPLSPPEAEAKQEAPKPRRTRSRKAVVPVYSEEISKDVASQITPKRTAPKEQEDPVFKRPSSPIATGRGSDASKKRKSIDSNQGTSLNESIPSPGNFSASTRAAKIRLMFTGIENPPLNKVRDIGVKLTEDVTNCNVFVAQKFTRTIKMMYAVARGVPIVSLKWVESSFAAKKIQDFDEYLLLDKAAEKKHGFVLAQSLRKSVEKKIFEGWSFFVTKNCVPNAQQLAAILSGCNASVISKKPSSFKEKTAIITCPQDFPVGSSSVPVATVEFILNGILRHEVDFEPYKLAK